MRKLPELISRFDKIRDRLKQSISAHDSQADGEVIVIDQLLEEALKELLNSELHYQSEKLDRIRFVFNEVKAICGEGSLVQRLLETAKQDILSIAYAEPVNAVPADPEYIRELFIGNSWYWSEGGCVYHKDGTFEAFWEGALALGKWSIDERATLYNNAIWYDETTDGPENYHFLEYFRHVNDPAGNLWQHEFDEGWVIFDTADVANGNRYGSQIVNFRKKFGVEDLVVGDLAELDHTPSIN